MSYIKQNFVDKETALRAKHLQHMEEGIFANTEAIEANANIIAAISADVANERTERIESDAVISARMDAFTTLPNGSTLGDAELADIRVDAWGKTHTNAGTAVRSQVNELSNGMKVVGYRKVQYAVVDNAYLNAEGTPTAVDSSGGNSWHVVQYVRVFEGLTYYYTNLNVTGEAPHSAFYDANQNLVSVFKQEQGTNIPLTIPNGVAYVRFSTMAINNVLKFDIYENASVTDLLRFKNDVMSGELFTGANMTRDNYINSNGNEQHIAPSNGYWQITDYMPVDPNGAYSYSNLNVAGSAPHSAYYDVDKKLVSVFKQVQGENIPLEVPSNAAYVRFSIYYTAKGYNGFSLWNEFSIKHLEEKIEAVAFDNGFWSDYGICINGDSIETESAGRWSAMLKNRVPFKSYQNIAVGGTRIQGQINSDERIAKISSDTDILITAGGTNDWAQNIPLGSLDTLEDPNTFYGAVDLYIKKVLEKFPDMIVVMASNHFGCCPDRFTDSKDVASGIYNDIDVPIYRYAKAIKDVAEFNSVYYVPIFEECGINKHNYETYNLSEYNNNGDHVYLHPNNSGAEKMLDVYLRHLEMISKRM